jgi:alkylated DNA repair protein alkB family protein 6
MPHEDGGTYAPVVATVSLGATICLEITRKPETAAGETQPESNEISGANSGTQYVVPTRIVQEPRSLLITTGSAYNDLLHGISSVEVDENLNADTVANWHLLSDSSVFEEAGGRHERGTRISLTYRDVLKVSSAANKIFGGLARR